MCTGGSVVVGLKLPHFPLCPWCKLYPAVVICLTRSIHDRRNVPQIDRHAVNDIDQQVVQFPHTVYEVPALQYDRLISIGPVTSAAEEVGQLQIADFVPKRMVLLNYTLAALSEDGKLMLGEIRTRGGDDWALAGRSVVALNAKYSEERR